jgi:hypothetical protein
MDQGWLEEVEQSIKQRTTKDITLIRSARTILLMKSLRCINPMHGLYVEPPVQTPAMAHIEILR